MATTERWRSVLDDLRAAIRSGQYMPGQRLPTVDQLMERYDISSRPIVQKVLAALATEGLVVAVHRKGTYVRAYSPIDWDTSQDAWAAGVAAQGRTPRQTETVEIATAPPEVAKRLEVEPGTEVAVRRLLRYVDDAPFQTADTYYAPWVTSGGAPGDAIPGGSTAAFRSITSEVGATTGHVQVRLRDEIVIRMPEPSEQERLSLPPGTPVADHLRIGFDADDRPISVTATIAPGDRLRIVYERNT